jgi:hypothetical protein
VANGAVGEEHDAVDELEDAESGLVDGEHDGLAMRGGHAPEHLDNVERGAGVEPRRGLVQQQHGRVAHEVHPDGHPPPLTAGDVGDSGRSDVLKAELCHQLPRPLRAGRPAAGPGRAQAQARAVDEGLLDGERQEQR